MIKQLIFLKLLLPMGLILLLASCAKQNLWELDNNVDIAEIENFENFDFSTVEQYNISISYLDNRDLPLDGVYCEIYLKNPLNNDGLMIKDADQSRIFKGISDQSGHLQCLVNPPTFVDSIFILTLHAGIAPLHSLSLKQNALQVILGGSNPVFKSGGHQNFKSSMNNPPQLVNGYYRLGGWNSNGVPDYLENTNDHISSEFLQNVNASLPEHLALPESHPQYLADRDDANIIVLEECEVWVTFVHEGAGWHNTLGYYTYQTGSTPQSIQAITDRTIIFPDVSNYSSGLSVGNKVQLMYLDPVTNEYTPNFPAGTTIGWFLIAKGWANGTVGNGVYTHYSDLNLNNESNLELQKHNVLLFDAETERLLMGFEDIRRDNPGCDNDFNDAIFFTSVSPVTAVDLSIYQPIDEPTDTDNDGVTDVFDAYPNDPNRAFASSYPGTDQYGTLVYEDLWPNKGDYDFNDLVIEYNFDQITNNQNKLTAIKATIVVKAIGASYHNAFGISFNTSPSNISSVTGQRFTKDYLNINSNGTENGQSKAVIIFFDDAYNVLHYPGVGHFVNTDPNSVYVEPETILVEIDFINPISFNEIGTPPYNPFIIVNRDRGAEVHLPNMPPTDLIDQSLLGTGHDDSDPSLDKFYVSDKYLPWAINLPVSFNYIKEKESISEGYLQFNNWARSNGFSYMDWYMDIPNYRNTTWIYSH